MVARLLRKIEHAMRTKTMRTNEEGSRASRNNNGYEDYNPDLSFSQLDARLIISTNSLRKFSPPFLPEAPSQLYRLTPRSSSTVWDDVSNRLHVSCFDHRSLRRSRNEKSLTVFLWHEDYLSPMQIFQSSNETCGWFSCYVEIMKLWIDWEWLNLTLIFQLLQIFYIFHLLWIKVCLHIKLYSFKSVFFELFKVYIKKSLTQQKIFFALF